MTSQPKLPSPKPNAAPRRWRGFARLAVWSAIAAMLVIGGILGYRWLDASQIDFDVVIAPRTIAADNSSTALLEIKLLSRFGNQLNVHALPYAPRVEIVEGAHLVKLIPLGDSLSYRLKAGVEMGEVVVHVHIYGAPGPIEARLDLTASLADHNHNGYPDALDLTSESDRTAFRRWFTTIALGQLTHVDDRWHDRDCAGLLRYCYREALKAHDNAWLAGRKWLITSAIPDVRKYNYPAVPLVGTRIFNVGEDGAVIHVGAVSGSGRTEPQATSALTGSQSQPDPEPAHAPRRNHAAGDPRRSFSDYAEAARLKDNSLTFVSRDVADALPGDVIFYLNDTDSDWPYHSMIYLGGGMTVYHTGPDGDNPGIVKKLSLEQLGRHPNSRWHPVRSNPYFLGFYRWRILT